jgi:adenylate cyclase
MTLLVPATSSEKNINARQSLENGLVKDPKSADNWARLSISLMSDYLNHWNECKEYSEAGKDLVRRAEHAANEALKIDPAMALTHIANALVLRVRGDHTRALDALDRAIQLDQNLALAYIEKADQLVMLGRPQEALPLVQKAIMLSPNDVSLGLVYWVLGHAYFVMGDFNQAIEWLQKSVNLRPDLWFNRVYLLSAHALIDRHHEVELTILREYLEYSVRRIHDFYDNELPCTDQWMQASIESLYEGLRRSGLPMGNEESTAERMVGSPEADRQQYEAKYAATHQTYDLLAQIRALLDKIEIRLESNSVSDQDCRELELKVAQLRQPQYGIFHLVGAAGYRPPLAYEKCADCGHYRRR